MLDRVYVVSTPENLALRFERSGLATRAAALVIDVGCMAILLQLAAWLLQPLGRASSSAATVLWTVAAFAVQWFYGALSEWRFGCTVGKRLLGLRVVDSTGLPPSLLQAAARNLLRLVDFLPGLHLVGAIVCLIDPLGRRLGDLAAQTVVVRSVRSREPSAPARALAGPMAAYADALALRLSAAERATLQLLVARIDQLPLDVRVELCEQLEHHLSTRYRVVRPAQISSERALLLVQAAMHEPSGWVRP